MIMEFWMRLAEAWTSFWAHDPHGIMVETNKAWIPIAIAAVSAAGSLYQKHKEAKDAERQAGAGNAMTEAARQDAMQRLSPEALYTAFQTFFPGLVGAPGDTNAGAPTSLGGYDPQSDTGGVGIGVAKSGAVSAPGQISSPNAPPSAPGGIDPSQVDTFQGQSNQRFAESLGADGARAQGGPVQAGQSYLVGEQGPEVVTPAQNGNVTPNPATGGAPAAPTGAGDMGAGTAPTPGVQQPTVPGAPPTEAGATSQQYVDPSAGQQVNASDLAMNRMFELLANPGQFSTADYERRQEEASAGYQSRVQDITAQSMAGGIDPGSGVSSSMMAGAAKQEAGLKSEAARDQQLIEQQLRRADIAAGSNMFMGMMNYILQLQGSRASVASGQFANPQIVTPNMGAGIAQFGDQVGQAVSAYNANSPTSSNSSDGDVPNPGQQ